MEKRTGSRTMSRRRTPVVCGESFAITGGEIIAPTVCSDTQPTSACVTLNDSNNSNTHQHRARIFHPRFPYTNTSHEQLVTRVRTLSGLPKLFVSSCLFEVPRSFRLILSRLAGPLKKKVKQAKSVWSQTGNSRTGVLVLVLARPLLTQSRRGEALRRGLRWCGERLRLRSRPELPRSRSRRSGERERERRRERSSRRSS